MKVADHQTRGKRPHTKAKRKTQSKLCQAILTIALMASSFYFGILVGMHSSLLDCELGNGEATQQLSQEQIEELVRKKVKEGAYIRFFTSPTHPIHKSHHFRHSYII